MTDRRKVNTNSGLLAPPIRIAVFLTLLFILVVSDGYAKDYGNYDPALILTETETSSGRKHGINTVYLDRILNDLAFHAQNYPPQFDSPPGPTAGGLGHQDPVGNAQHSCGWTISEPGYPF